MGRIRMLLGMLFFSLCLTGCAQGESEGEISLTSINVGKADCHLLRVEDTVYMIDTGTAESWGAVSRALHCLGIQRLDGVVLTHTDKDHAGGLPALASSGIAVDAWYAGQYFTDVEAQKHPALLAASQRGMEVQWLTRGDTLPVPQGTLAVLWPGELDEDKENNNSVVLRLDTARGSILLTGDLEQRGEERLASYALWEQATVLKVGHHGEGDATGSGMLARVQPQVAVISTNSVEEPDTPSPRVMKLLQAAHCQILLTEETEGAVKVSLLEGGTQTEHITFTPPEIKEQVVISDKSVAQDAVTLRNDGEEAADLSGWYLYSERGKETFVFPQGTFLAPGESLTITTLSSEDAGDLTWQETQVWHRKKADTAILYDVFGRMISQLE